MSGVKNNENFDKFDGSKYSLWKRRLYTVLDEEDILHVITKPVPTNLNEEYVKSEKRAKRIIVQNLDNKVLSCTKITDNARMIIETLDNIYEKKTLASQLALEDEFMNLKYKDDTPLLAHFMKFEEMLVDIQEAGTTIHQTSQIARLLMTMPKSYCTVISAIKTRPADELNLESIKTILLDRELELIRERKDTSLNALQVTAIKYNKPYNKQTFHKKIFKNNFKRPVFKKEIKCFYCNKKGHIKKNCFLYQKTIKNKQFTRENINDKNNEAQFAVRQQSDGIAFMIRRATANPDNTKISFVIDSGASDHIVNNEKFFENAVNLEHPIKLSVAKRDEFMNATKKGVVQFYNNQQQLITLKNVLLCNDAPYNLLSVKRMQDAGMTIIFNAGGVKVTKNGKLIFEEKYVSTIPIVNFILNKVIYSTKIVNNNSEYRLWHERFGHISKGKFLEIINRNMFADSDRIRNVQPSNEICEACINGKQARLSFNKAKNKSYIQRPLYIIHSDVCGPITPSTIDSKNYYVIFIDQYTHYCVTYLMTNKSDVFNFFKDFVAKSEAHFNLKIVNLYIDNGREYLSNEMKDYCVGNGITYHLTIPHTPQLNGVSERMVRTITEKARSMINGAKLPKEFWGEAVLTATYLLNRTPSNALKGKNKTPYEMWHNRKPDLKYLKVFGATMYVLNKTRKNKFDEKSMKLIFIGYCPNGYKLWDVEGHKFISARDVIADETNMRNTRPVAKFDLRQDLDKENESDELTSGEKASIKQAEACDSALQNAEVTPNQSSSLDTNTNKRNIVETEIRRSKRLKELPRISYEENDIDKCLMSAEIFINKTPQSYSEIKDRLDRSCWEKAMTEELDAHMYNNTWTIVQKPKNKNIVDCRWVFSIKHDELGNVVRHKARLVAKGFTQQYLVDYDEIFAPVARVSSFRFLIAFSNQFNLQIHHMDVKTAFLNGDLKEEIYMSIPPGLSCENDKVCKLNKAIYGLKQAARCWFEVFEKVLKEKGFRNSASDRCIYILELGEICKNIYVLLYVDDIVIATADMNAMTNFKNYLKKRFQMTDLSEIKYFIGICVETLDKTIYLSQSVYIQNVLRKFNMENCKPINTPLPSVLDIEGLESDETCNAPCRELIGCLMYIMLCTRPDLSASISILSRYSNKNNKVLWQYLKRVLRYLSGTIKLRLVYEQKLNYNDILIGYADSDWGGNVKDRRSTTGFLFKIFENCLITWNTKKQNSVASSSTEAEYMALFEAVREALWLKSLVNSIGFKLEHPIKIYEDNQGCISIANNPSCHKRSKHIDIKYHFSREQVENKFIKVEYIPTEHQLADILTKSLPPASFLKLRCEMGLKNINSTL